MNNKEHIERLRLIINILIKKRAPKDQYFFGDADEIHRLTDWLAPGPWGDHTSLDDGEVIRFSYAGFTFHCFEIPANKEFQWTDDLVKEYGNRCAESGYTSNTAIGCNKLNGIFDAFKSRQQPKKEWEILKVKSPHTDPHEWTTLCEINNECTPYSVRRLSDGEVFTVGDKVESMLIKEDAVITGFEVAPPHPECMVYFGNRHSVNVMLLSKPGRPMSNQCCGTSYKTPETIKTWEIVETRIGESSKGDILLAVRRLSDGVVFCIGDLIQHHRTPICKFSLRDDNEIWVHVSETSDEGCVLSRAKKRVPGEPFRENPAISELLKKHPEAKDYDQSMAKLERMQSELLNHNHGKTVREVALEMAVKAIKNDRANPPAHQFTATATAFEDWLNRTADEPKKS